MSVEVEPSPFEEREQTDITLHEYDESDPIEIDDRSIDFIKREVNRGTEQDRNRINLSFDRNGHATLKATSYVGIVGLPDGPTIEIRPKAAGTQLLNLLRYAHGVESTTFEQETQLRRGEVFIEAIAALFESELSRVLTRGLDRGYRERSGSERHLRGRLDIQRQLQRQLTRPAHFECTYEELTPDITLNQAILFATTILLRLSRDGETVSRLKRHQQLLRQRVTLRPVSPFKLREIEVTRLNEYYNDLLRFTELILGNIHIEELTTGERSSFSLLVNMNTVFEKVVERAAKGAIEDRQGWRVKAQDPSKNLVDGGRYNVKLKPDFTIRDEAGRVRIVGDAKWKIENPANADFYQLAAYESAFEAPGLLVYPEQENTVSSTGYLPGGRRLDLIELPTAIETNSYSQFCEQLEERMRIAIDSFDRTPNTARA